MTVLAAWNLVEGIAFLLATGGTLALIVHAISRSKNPPERKKLRAEIERLRQEGYDYIPCDRCKGSSFEVSAVYFGFGRSLLSERPCSACGGSGILIRCQSCGCDLTGNKSGICPECGSACQVRGGTE